MTTETEGNRDKAPKLKQNQGLPVEQIFSEPGFYLFITGYQNGFQALSMFDNPEALIAREMPGGETYLLARRSDVYKLGLIERVAVEVAKERGYQIAEYWKLSPEDYTEVRIETSRRIEEELARTQFE